MKMKSLTAAVAFISVIFTGWGHAQIFDTNNVNVGTVAGYGIPSYVDGQGLLSAFNDPTLIVSDTASNLYVWDSANQRIRKITPDRTVTTFAGGGTYLEGYTTNVSLAWGQISAMAMNHSNQIWLVMNSGYYSGMVYLLTADTNGYVSIVNGGLTNLSLSSGICFDSANNLYYSGGNRIYRYDTASGNVEIFAGSGVSGYFDGSGILLTAFASPTALACDPMDNIYVWDSGNNRIRRVDQFRNVTTVAGNGGYSYSLVDGNGTNANISQVNSIFFDPADNLYLMCGNYVRKMDAGANVDSLAGNFNGYTAGYADGPGNTARFNSANAGCFSQGMVFVADAGNNRIRNITFNATGQNVSPASLQLNTYAGVQITGTLGRIYQIQSSPDLTNWVSAATVLLNTSPYLWIDNNPVADKKFYRAVLQP
jgi:hypothetical protein